MKGSVDDGKRVEKGEEEDSQQWIWERHGNLKHYRTERWIMRKEERVYPYDPSPNMLHPHLDQRLTHLLHTNSRLHLHDDLFPIIHRDPAPLLLPFTGIGL